MFSHITQGIDSIAAQPTNKLPTLSSTDWSVLTELHIFLGLFDDLTKLASRDLSPSLSNTIPMFNKLLDHLEDSSKDSNPTAAVSTQQKTKWFISVNHICKKIVIEAAKAATLKITEYYQLTPYFNCLVTVLDPRYNYAYYIGVQKLNKNKEMWETFKS